MQLESLLTIEEAAAHLGCSVATVWRRVNSGHLIPVRVLQRTLFQRQDVESMPPPRRGHPVPPTSDGQAGS